MQRRSIVVPLQDVRKRSVVERQWIRYTLVLAGILIPAFNASAFDVESRAIVRKGKRLHEERVVLANLREADRLEGEHFRIVAGTSEDPVPVTSLKGATLYFHLERARDFFAGLGDLLNADQRAALGERITVRMDIDVEYSDANHFVTGPKKVYNTCKTIPKSAPVVERMGRVAPWGLEIWFHPAKTIRRKTMAAMGNHLKSGEFGLSVFEQLLTGDLTRFAQAGTAGSFDPTMAAASLAFSLGLSQLVPRGVGLAIGSVKTRFRLDTAMIPEIIYHEYSHAVIKKSDLELKRSTQIIEGFPNFFAYKISGLSNLADHDGAFGIGTRGKSAKYRGLYSFDQDLFSVAIYGSFTYSLLVQLEHALGDEGFMILWNAMGSLTYDSDLKNDFVREVLSSIDRFSSNPEAKRWAALRVFMERGF